MIENFNGVKNTNESKVEGTEVENITSVRYPTGVFHKETEFEKNIKENKEPKLIELYDNLGKSIDKAFLESIEEYKHTENSEPVSMNDEYKKGDEVIGRSGVEVEDKKITFHFGGGYSSLTYYLQESEQKKLFLNRKNEYKALLPADFLEIFNKKLSLLDRSFKSTVENF